MRPILLFVILIICSCDRAERRLVANGKSNVDSILTTVPEINRPAAAKELLRNFDSENSNITRQNLQRLIRSLYKFGLKNEFYRGSAMLLRKSHAANDSLHLTHAYKNLGTFYIENGRNDSSYYYYVKAEKLATEIESKPLLGQIYLDIAFILLYEGDFSGSEIAASKALTFLERDNLFQIYDAYNLIGICSNELKNYDRAIEYHRKAYDFYLLNNLVSRNHLGASSLNNIGYVYQSLGNHQEAIKNFQIALRDKNLFDDSPGLYAMLLDNLAYSKFKLNDLEQLPELFKKALKIRDSLGFDQSGIILNKVHLSEFYFSQGDTINAISIAKDALQTARLGETATDILVSLDHLTKIEQENAHKYYKEYIAISDSLQLVERNTKDKFARIQYETNEITIEKDKLADQNRTLLYFFVVTSMIGILLFVIRSQRTRNRELILKQAQQKANEDIYNLIISQQQIIEESRSREKKRIARELHDGVLGRLFGTRLNLDSLNKLTDVESILKRNEYLAELKNIEQDIREISHDLNREKFALINNFTAILNNLVDEQQESFNTNIRCTIDESINWDNVENILKINLYRIIQESLQNINKYAEANNVSIEIKLAGTNLMATISDDGKGFDLNNRKKGIGLQNMISRANELEGTVDIRTKKGKGTSVIATFPQNQ